MSTTLEEWDRYIAPKLKDIQIDAAYCRVYADKIINSVNNLNLRPNFKTIAEEELANTICVLKYVVSILEDAEQRLKEKPIDV